MTTNDIRIDQIALAIAGIDVGVKWDSEEWPEVKDHYRKMAKAVLAEIDTDPRKTMERGTVIDVITDCIADNYFDWDDGSGQAHMAELEEGAKIAEMIMSTFDHFDMIVTCLDED